MNLVKKISDKEKAYLDEEVEIEFYNIEEPGVSLEFSYGPANDIKNYKLLHGGKHRLTRRVVQHIESKGPANWVMRPDGLGSSMAVKEGSRPRFQCRVLFSA